MTSGSVASACCLLSWRCGTIVVGRDDPMRRLPLSCFALQRARRRRDARDGWRWCGGAAPSDIDTSNVVEVMRRGALAGARRRTAVPLQSLVNPRGIRATAPVERENPWLQLQGSVLLNARYARPHSDQGSKIWPRASSTHTYRSHIYNANIRNTVSVSTNFC
jgi:hypothetical protein